MTKRAKTIWVVIGTLAAALVLPRLAIIGMARNSGTASGAQTVSLVIWLVVIGLGIYGLVRVRRGGS